MQDIRPRDHALELPVCIDHTQGGHTLLAEQSVGRDEALADVDRFDRGRHILAHGHFEIGHQIFPFRWCDHRTNTRSKGDDVAEPLD